MQRDWVVIYEGKTIWETTSRDKAEEWVRNSDEIDREDCRIASRADLKETIYC